MKIGIISINLHTKDLNFACPLHSYAMQKFLEKNGYESEVIDYKPSNFDAFNMRHPAEYYEAKHEEHLRSFPSDPAKVSSWYKKEHSLKQLADNFRALYKERETRYDKFQIFINKYLKITEKDYDSDTLELEDPGFDCYICATDVIWKSRPRLERAYFLASKCMENKWKISYAASRNSSRPKTEQEENLFFYYLDDFDVISVRETSLKKYIEEKSNLKATVVLDPVMLHDRAFYEKIAKPPKERNYLFLYHVIKNADDTIEQAVQYAKAHNLKIIEYSDHKSPNADLAGRDDVAHKWYYDLGIEEVLGYIMYADCVFTNSFHCSCFSILFGRDFFVGWRNGDKVYNLLEAFNLEERHFNDKTDFSVPIDYARVEKILQKKRKESEEFILNALKSIEGRMRPHKDYSAFRQNITYPVAYNMCLPDSGISRKEKVKNSPEFSPAVASKLFNDGTAKLIQENIKLSGYRFMGWNLRFQIDNAWYWILDDNSFYPVTENANGLTLRLFKGNDNIPHVPVNRISKITAEAVWEEIKPMFGFGYHSGKKANLFDCLYSEKFGMLKTTPKGYFEYSLFDNIANNGEAIFPENKFIPKTIDGSKLDFVGWYLRFFVEDSWYWYMSDGTKFPRYQQLPNDITVKLFNPGDKLPIITKELVSKAVAVAKWI